jgi:hypothetical protein
LNPRLYILVDHLPGRPVNPWVNWIVRVFKGG